MNLRYVASLIQSGTSAPVDTVIHNDFPNDFTWSRTSAGVYVATQTGALNPFSKAIMFMADTTNIVSYQIVDNNSFMVTAAGDGLLTGQTIDVTLFDYDIPVTTSPYCSQTDVELRMSALTLAQLANDTAGATSADPTVVAAILAQVGTLIDSYVGTVYQLPFTIVPDLIRRVAIDIACFYFFQRHPINLDMPNIWKDGYKNAMDILVKITNQVIELPLTAVIQSPMSAIGHHGHTHINWEGF
jgi:phage gp36-like protein